MMMERHTQGHYGLERGVSVETTLVDSLGIVLLVCLIDWTVLSLTRLDNGLTVFWASSGLLVGLLLSVPQSRWSTYIPAAFAGSLLARGAMGEALPEMIVYAGACTLEAVLVANTVRRRFGEHIDYGKPVRLARTATTAALFATGLSALLAASVSNADAQSFATSFVQWWSGHALGIVIFATMTLVARNLGWRIFGRKGQRVRFLLDLAFVGAVTLAVFSQSRYPFLFLVYPPLVYLVFRHGYAGVVLGGCPLLLTTVFATLTHSGPLMLIDHASATERILVLQLFIAMGVLVTLPIALVLRERKHLMHELRNSERNYRLLAENTRDLIVRRRSNGEGVYVSPSVFDILGRTPAEWMAPRWSAVHPDDRKSVDDAIKHLLSTGAEATMVYRVQHRDGHYVWLESLARRVESNEPDVSYEVVYSARDISQRVALQNKLSENQDRLRAITDNLPAIVTYVDAQQRYVFANAQTRTFFGIEPADAIGRTVREVRGKELYDLIRPHIEAALRGQHVTFESEINAMGRRMFMQSNYIPDFAPNGSVKGYYAMTYDLSDLNTARQELKRLAGQDSLTGLANRRAFDERIAQALERANKYSYKVALLYLDVDHFKGINDAYGHATGDVVLRKFASRLTVGLRNVDLAVRLGGDEFVVLMDEVYSADAADTLAQRIITAMKEEIVTDTAKLRISTSIGVGVSRPGDSAESLMNRADDALYRAKNAGRSTYRLVA